MATGNANINVNINASEANNTIRSLNAEYFRLKRAIKDAEVGSDEYNRAARRLSELRGVIADHNRAITQTQNSWNSLRNVATNALSISAGLFAIDQIVDFGGELLNVTDKVKAYETALDSLSAITGVTGDDLRDLENRAAQLTAITVAGGKEITNTSTDILDAFRLVGSAKPELLKSAEGMQAFTREAIIFAKAGAMPVEEAVTALSTTLSQFEAPATDAARYINAMSAGAKEGSAEISDVAAAIKEFGAGAASYNVTVEESVALTETLGDKMIKGSEAGTALRNILLIMKAPDALSKEAREELDKHNVSTKILADTNLSLSVRLHELSKIGNDATAMTKIFGKENVTAGEILLRNVDRFDALTKSVSGTSEAYTQAAILSDNLGTDIENMKNQMSEAATQAGNALSPAVRSLVQGFTGLIKWIQENIAGIRTFIGILASAGLVVGAYYAAVQAVIIAKRVWTAVTAAASTVQLFFTDGLFRSIVAVRALNFVMSANPIGVFIALVTAAAAAIAMLSNRVTQAARNQMLLNEVNIEAAKATLEQKTKLQQLLEVARDEKRSKEDRIKAVKALNELSPHYLGNLTLEKIGTQEATDAVNKYVAALDKRAKADAALSKRTELERKLLDLKTTGAGSEVSYLQMAGNALASLGSVQKAAIFNMQSGINNAKEVRAGVESEIAALNKYVSENQIDFTTNTVDNTSKNKNKGDNNGGSSNTNAKDDKVNKEQELLNKLRELLVTYQNDIDQINANHDQAEMLKIQEKYDKQIKAAKELLLSKDPNVRKEAAQIVGQLIQKQHDEVLAVGNKHYNDLLAQTQKREQDIIDEKQSADDRRINDIRQSYAKQIEEAKQLELSKLPEIASKGLQLRLQIEQNMNAEIAQAREKARIERAMEAAKQTIKDNEETKAFWEQQAKIKQDFDNLIKDLQPDSKIKEEDTLEVKLTKLKAATDAEIAELERRVAAQKVILGDDAASVEALTEALEKKKTEIVRNALLERTRLQAEELATTMSNYSELINNLGNAFKSLGDIIGNETEEVAALQKIAGIAKIAVDTATAISGIISVAATTSLDPITMAIRITAGIATVLSNIAAAKKLLASAPDVKQKYEGGFTDVTGATDKKTYRARYINAPDTGMLPNSPVLYPSASGYPVLASEKGREFLVSNKSLQNPIIFNHVRAIQNIEKYGYQVPQFAEGGFTNNTNTTASDQSQTAVLIALTQEISKLNAHLDSGIIATIQDATIVDIMKRYRKIDNISGGAISQKQYI